MTEKLAITHDRVFNLGSLISQALQEPLFLCLTECEGGHFIKKRRSGWLWKKGLEFLEAKCLNRSNKMLAEGSKIGTTPPFPPSEENNQSEAVIRTQNSITAIGGWDNGTMALLLTLILHYSRTNPLDFQRITYHYEDFKERERRVEEAVLKNGNLKDLSQGFYLRASIEVKTPYNKAGKFEEVHFMHTAFPSDGLDISFVTPSPLRFVKFLANFAGLRWEFFNGNDLYATGLLYEPGYRINILAKSL